MVFAPKHEMYLWTRYNLGRTVPGGLVRGSLGVNHESRRFTHASLGNRVELPGYTRVDIGGYYESERLSFALNLEILLDEEYVHGRLAGHASLSG